MTDREKLERRKVMAGFDQGMGWIIQEDGVVRREEGSPHRVFLRTAKFYESSAAAACSLLPDLLRRRTLNYNGEAGPDKNAHVLMIEIEMLLCNEGQIRPVCDLIYDAIVALKEDSADA